MRCYRTSDDFKQVASHAFSQRKWIICQSVSKLNVILHAMSVYLQARAFLIECNVVLHGLYIVLCWIRNFCENQRCDKKNNRFCTNRVDNRFPVDFITFKKNTHKLITSRSETSFISLTPTINFLWFSRVSGYLFVFLTRRRNFVFKSNN